MLSLMRPLTTMHPLMRHRDMFDAFDFVTDASPFDLLDAHPRRVRARGFKNPTSIESFKEHEESYSMTITAPGVAATDISIESHDGLLVVKGETTTDNTHASFAKAISLPPRCNLEAASATHVDGVLTITLPKADKPAPKRIAVNGLVPSKDADEPMASAEESSAGAEPEVAPADESAAAAAPAAEQA